MSCRVPISMCLDQGADRLIKVTFRDKATKVGLDLTGVTSSFVLRESDYRGAFIALYTQADNIDVTLAGQGTLVVHLAAALPLLPTKEYFGDWRMTHEGLETRIATYKFKIDGKAALS